MGNSFKKAIGIIKAVFLFIIENWHTVIAFSGVILSSVFAGLGLFFEFFRNIMKIRIILPLWMFIVVSPFVLYAIIMVIVKLIRAIRKPPYLSFTAMEYQSTKNHSYKLEWNYVKDKNKYIPKNIHPVCHNCGCELAPMNYQFIYCPVCRQDICDPIPDIEYGAIIKIIEYKIRNKLY
jgi:hypothetical protein